MIHGDVPERVKLFIAALIALLTVYGGVGCEYAGAPADDSIPVLVEGHPVTQAELDAYSRWSGAYVRASDLLVDLHTAGVIGDDAARRIDALLDGVQETLEAWGDSLVSGHPDTASASSVAATLTTVLLELEGME